MELKSAEKYTTKIGDNSYMVNIPSKIMDSNFSLIPITFENGFTPVKFIWQGTIPTNPTPQTLHQPALVRNTTDNFYLGYSGCNKFLEYTRELNSFNYPSEDTGEFVFCNDGGRDEYFYFSLANPTPVAPNGSASLNFNNKSITVSKLTVFDENYRYGAHLSFTASYEGFQKGGGNGRILMFLTYRPLPVFE